MKMNKIILNREMIPIKYLIGIKSNSYEYYYWKLLEWIVEMHIDETKFKPKSVWNCLFRNDLTEEEWLNILKLWEEHKLVETGENYKYFVILANLWIKG
jgi:hypothetical protein